MSDLFNYFVKAASTYKPDAAMRRGSYAQASDRGQYRSSTIGHQGMSRRTAAQLRQTHNLPAPGQQQTGPDASIRRGSITQGGQSRTDASSNPSYAPRSVAPPATASANQSFATVVGAPPANLGPTAQSTTTQVKSLHKPRATAAGAQTARQRRLAAALSPYVPEVANWSDKDIRSAYARGAYWDSHRGLGTDIDKSIQGNVDWQLYNRLSQAALNIYGASGAQAAAANTALQNLDALRYRDDVANYDPLGESIAATQGVSPNATPEELALRQLPYDLSKLRPVMPRA